MLSAATHRSSTSTRRSATTRSKASAGASASLLNAILVDNLAPTRQTIATQVVGKLNTEKATYNAAGRVLHIERVPATLEAIAIVKDIVC